MNIIPIKCIGSKMKLIRQFIHNNSEAIKFLEIYLTKKVKHGKKWIKKSLGAYTMEIGRYFAYRFGQNNFKVSSCFFADIDILS